MALSFFWHCIIMVDPIYFNLGHGAFIAKIYWTIIIFLLCVLLTSQLFYSLWLNTQEVLHARIIEYNTAISLMLHWHWWDSTIKSFLNIHLSNSSELKRKLLATLFVYHSIFPLTWFSEYHSFQFVCNFQSTLCYLHFSNIDFPCISVV